MGIAALVEPVAELTAEQVERSSRHLLLPGLGLLGQRRLRAARVCVLGAGGLGAPVLQYLAAAGVALAEFSLGQPSLDEVFFALTGHPAEDRDGSAAGDGERRQAAE